MDDVTTSPPGRYIPRKCVERADDGREPTLRCLEDLRGLKAYILLGDIGAGKTTFFQREAEAGGSFLPVKDFLDLNQQCAPELWRQPLFIDGLDETSNSISRVRGKLDSLGKPRVRLSCRAADWGGKRNTDAIKALYPDVKVFHLEPFSDSEQRLFLESLGVADIDDMLAVGEWHGGNPLLLEMLSDIWDGGEIKNIKNFYDAVCRKLAQEHDSNRTDTARESGGVTPSPEQLMHVAGEMCAAMLCSDKAGFAEKAQGRYAGIDELLHKDEDGTLPRKVLTSKLFVSQKDGVYIPRHRSIAEFLGGRHLAGLVDDKKVKMSPARAGGFCGSADGGVVSGLRGMHAWLATCAKTPAPFLKTDAFGVASLGGFSNYGLKDQRLFLQYLLEQSGKNRDDYDLAPRHYKMLGVLPAVADAAKQELASGKRDHKQVDKAYLLLRIMEHAPTHSPFLNDVLMSTLKDEKWHGDVRARAAGVLGKQAKNDRDLGMSLHNYAKEMNGKKRLNDGEELVMSKLLGFLYPKYISASDIVNYYSHCSGRMLFGFWYDFPKRSDVTEKEAVEVLDQMGASIAEEAFIGDDLAERLFDKAISNDTEPRRVWRWLTAYAQKHERVPKPLRECIAKDNRLLFGLLDIAREQKRGDVPDILWCIQELRECGDAENTLDFLLDDGFSADARQAKQVAFQYAYYYTGWKRGEAKQQVNLRIGEDRIVREMHRDFRAGLAKVTAENRKWRRQVRHSQIKKDARTRQELAYIRKNISSIESGENLALLSELAFRVVVRGDSRDELLQQVDEAPIQKGCIAAVKSGNTPVSPKNVFDAKRNSRGYGLEFVYSLGMDAIYRRNPDNLLTLPRDSIRLAVAFDICGGISADWMGFLKKNHRDLVAETVKSVFDDGFDGVTNFGWWVNKNGDVFAPQERRELLRGLMGNAKGDGLFRAILRVSIRQKDDWLIELIDEQIRTSTLLSQRGLLAAAGFLFAGNPEKYADEARALMSEEKYRDAFSSFFQEDELYSLSARHQALFAGLFAPFAFVKMKRVGWVGPTMKQMHMVRELITILEKKGAVKELNGLAEAAKDGARSASGYWEHWITQLEYAKGQAVVVSRDSQHSPLPVSRVVASLRGDAPASAHDLRDMLMESLDNLRETKYCKGNPDNLRDAYWNTADKNAPVSKGEVKCRGPLAEAIRNELPQSCRVDSESLSAGERRADLLVSFGEFEVPVEIKKASNRELWSGIEDQLADYARRPKAHGRGVYLVLWFGDRPCQKPPDDFSLSKPQTPDELELALTEFVKQGGHNGIRVFVMDLSL